MDNLWQRRSTSGKQTFSNGNSNGKDDGKTGQSRTYQPAKRFDSFSKATGPTNGMHPLSTTNVQSPGGAASSAFGLGSGAFASFGSSGKTPRTPGSALEFSSNPTSQEKSEKDDVTDISRPAAAGTHESSDHALKSTWIVWYRPPTSKHSDYEKSTVPLAYFSSVEMFWAVYSHLKRPSALPSVSDYHIFKKGIRPVWEDEGNKKGGKWIIRLKKGVADRFWEDLLLAIVGDQFAEAGEEVCGAVLSIRSGEDVLSVWTRIDGGRNIKIRETIKRLLAFPADTAIVWKSHDDSIAQRSAIDQARHDKSGTTQHATSSKRRETINEDSGPERYKASAS